MKARKCFLPSDPHKLADDFHALSDAEIELYIPDDERGLRRKAAKAWFPKHGTDARTWGAILKGARATGIYAELIGYITSVGYRSALFDWPEILKRDFYAAGRVKAGGHPPQGRKKNYSA